MNNEPNVPPKYKYPGTIMETDLYPAKIKPPADELSEKEARMALEKRIAALEEAAKHAPQGSGGEIRPADGEKTT